MKRLVLLGSVAVLAVLPQAGIAAQPPVAQKTFRIDVSARETMKTQDWSGKAEITKGRIVKVEKTSGSSDTIHPDMSWTVVYGRGLKSQPKKLPAAKALLIITVNFPAVAAGRPHRSVTLRTVCPTPISSANAPKISRKNS